jgi:cell division protein FtsA
MFHLVCDENHRAGYEKSLNSGIVLTGGAANLEGMTEIAEQIFDLPVRRGSPSGIGGLADHVRNPSFATAVGLLLRAHRQHRQDANHPSSRGIGRLTDLVKGVFKEFF